MAHRSYGIILTSTCTSITRLVPQGEDWTVQRLCVDQEVTLTTAELETMYSAVQAGEPGDGILARLMTEEPLPPQCLSLGEEGV